MLNDWEGLFHIENLVVLRERAIRERVKSLC
jgi:hypothetical protein